MVTGEPYAGRVTSCHEMPLSGGPFTSMSPHHGREGAFLVAGHGTVGIFQAGQSCLATQRARKGTTSAETVRFR